MKYKCKSLSLSELNVGPFGVQPPLCDNCCNKDCTNLIVDKDISIFGITKRQKLLMKATGFYAVVDCEGFILCTKEQTP